MVNYLLSVHRIALVRFCDPLSRQPLSTFRFASPVLGFASTSASLPLLPQVLEHRTSCKWNE